MYWSSQEKCSCVSVLYTGHVKEPGLSCVVGAPVSCVVVVHIYAREKFLHLIDSGLFRKSERELF